MRVGTDVVLGNAQAADAAASFIDEAQSIVERAQ
jgi:multiple sugar transport system substrate-binding protein